MRNIVDETILMEKFAISILEKNGFENLVHVSESNPVSDFDIGNEEMTVRFDVKHASPTMVSRKKRVPIWSFDLRKGVKKKPRVTPLDYYVCVGLKHNRPDRVFLVPMSEAPSCHLRISAFGKSKWNQYIIWEKL